MAVMQRFERFRALSPPERGTFLAALWLLPACSAALRVLGLQRVLRQLPPASSTNAAPHDARRVAYCVDAAARQLPLRTTCLTRSLVLHRLLWGQGVASEVRIGVRVVDGRLDAHAWVECGGAPLNDAPDVRERYAAFEGLLAPQAFSP